MVEKVLVLGAGQAAISFAAKLRELDEQVEITLVGDEPHLPYQRPPLSKKYVMGEMSMDRLALKSPDWYTQNNITCMSEARAERINTTEKTVTLFDGQELAYDRLVLATGSRPRMLPAAMGGDLEGVHCIRSIADADRIRDLLVEGANVLVIGGGYIGLEAAAVAASRGLNVTLVEMADRILQRVASADTSDFFRQLHQSHDVAILEQTGLETLIGEGGKVKAARLANGDEIVVDFVLVGIGILTNSELAEQAGILVDNGISVDEHGETSVPGIYACGDCASFPYRGTVIRLESVQNAIEQAENIAINMTGGDVAYAPIPWFWSDQYDVKLQIAGLNSGFDQTVIRPGTREGTQSVWYFRQGEFLAVDSMNDPRAYMVGKKLLEAGKTITPAQAADASLELKALL